SHVAAWRDSPERVQRGFNGPQTCAARCVQCCPFRAQPKRSVHMKLLYQTHSPYARKTLVFAHEVGIAQQVEVVHHETSPTRRNEHVFAENPLGKVPVLIRAGLPSIFDSDVICAYFDTLHSGRKLIPIEGEARWQALRMQAASQGLADAGIAVRWETVRR